MAAIIKIKDLDSKIFSSIYFFIEKPSMPALLKMHIDTRDTTTHCGTPFLGSLVAKWLTLLPPRS